MSKADPLLLGLTAAGVVLVASALSIQRQNRVLTAQLDGLREAAAVDLELKAGTALPPLSGYDASGRMRSFAFPTPAGRRTVVFVFSSSCLASAELLPEWRRWAVRLGERQFRALAVDKGAMTSVSSAGEWVGLDVLAQPDAETMVAYNLQLTPQLIVIDPRGIVESVTSGRRRIEQQLPLLGAASPWMPESTR